jgi:hypothetical protein
MRGVAFKGRWALEMMDSENVVAVPPVTDTASPKYRGMGCHKKAASRERRKSKAHSFSMFHPIARHGFLCESDEK